MAGLKVGLGPNPRVSPSKQIGSTSVPHIAGQGKTISVAPSSSPIVVRPELLRGVDADPQHQTSNSSVHSCPSIFSDLVPLVGSRDSDAVEFQIELARRLRDLGPGQVAEELSRDLGPLSQLPIFDFVLKALTPDGGEVEIETDQMLLMGKKSREKAAKKKRKQTGGEDDKYPRILINGDYVHITPEGVQINHDKREPFFAYVVKIHRDVRDGARKEVVYRKILRMIDVVKENGTDAEYMRAALVASVGDDQAEQEFTEIDLGDITYEWGREFSNRSLTRIFGDLSFIPTEHGMWTELYQLWERYESGERGEVIYELTLRMVEYANILRDEVQFVDGKAIFGPIVFDDDKLLELFNGCIDYEIAKLTKRRVGLTRRDREYIAHFLPVNRAGRAWLDRTDIDEELKKKMALVYFLGNDGIVVEYFGAQENVTLGVAETEAAVTKLHSEFVESRFSGQAVQRSAPLSEPVADVRFRRITNLMHFWGLWRDQEEGELMPSISYNLFHDLRKHVSFYASTRGRAVALVGEARIREGGDLESHWQDNEYMIDYLSDESEDHNVRVMVFDLFIQVAKFDLDYFEEIVRLVKQNRDDSRRLRREVRRAYVEHIPYADQLMRTIKEELESEESPTFIATKLFHSIERQSDAVGKAWRLIMRSVRGDKRDVVRESFVGAISALDNDEELLSVWVTSLGDAMSEREVRERIAAYDPANDPSGIIFQRLLQDVAFPYDQSFDINRAEVAGVASLAIQSDVMSAFRSATTYLLPNEWEYLIASIVNLRSETVRAVRSFSGQDVPAFLRERYSLFRNGNLNNAISGITSILQGEYTEGSALAMREMIRAAIDDRSFDSFYSVLEIGDFVNRHNGDYRDIVEYLFTAAMGYVNSEQVHGDLLGLLHRRYLGGERGAHAELETLERYIEEGKSIRILRPDPSARERTPDFLVFNGGVPEAVEIKSRRWEGSESFRDLTSALFSAAEQISSFSRRTRYDEINGRIVLYIDSHDEPSKRRELLGLLAEEIRRRIDTFDSVNSVDVYFVRSSHKSWIVDSEHHFELR